MTRSLKDRVAYILERYPATRNSDSLLIMTLYEEYYYLTQTFSRQKLLAVMDDSAPDDIVRFRRQFQNDKVNPKYIPTSEDVMRKRRMNIDRCREILGYPVHHDTL